MAHGSIWANDAERAGDFFTRRAHIKSRRRIKNDLLTFAHTQRITYLFIVFIGNSETSNYLSRTKGFLRAHWRKQLELNYLYNSLPMQRFVFMGFLSLSLGISSCDWAWEWSDIHSFDSWRHELIYCRTRSVCLWRTREFFFANDIWFNLHLPLPFAAPSARHGTAAWRSTLCMFLCGAWFRRS